MKNKIMVYILSIIMIFSITGCGLGEKRQEFDSSKTQLFIGLQDTGVGNAWMHEIADKYMELHPNIEVVIALETDLYGQNNLLNSIGTSNIDVYFLNGIYQHDFVSKGYLMDLTELVTRKVDGKPSILDRLDNEVLKKSYSINGKYYAIPYFEALFGMVYDIDLFEKKGLYFDSNGNFVKDNAVKNGKLDGGQLSCGPDNKMNTIDDGLPQTYTQWTKLMTRMRQKGIIPFTWSAKNIYYRQRMLTGWWADYEGAENWSLNLTFDGYDTGLQKQINLENALCLQQQLGKKYAIQFAKDIISNNKNFDAGGFQAGTQNNIMAQDKFLNSTLTSAPIAMIAEGGWWEYEALDTFNELALEDENLAYGTRRFGLMPVPKADDSAFEGAKSSDRRTIINCGGHACVVINKRTEHKELAEDFFLFANSPENMAVFNTYTGCRRPYDYELSDEQYNHLTHFQKEVYDLSNDTNVDIVFNDAIANDLHVQNINYFNGWAWSSKISKGVTTDPLKAFKDFKDTTVDEYFNGLTDYYSNWPTLK